MTKAIGITKSHPLIWINDLFLYPDIDLAVIYLNEEFYKHQKKDDFIRVSNEFLRIGQEIGVLGYPLSELQFKSNDIKQPIVGNILLRTDKGVINTRYRTPKDEFLYEFTLAFNPGNSGGPIFDVRSGKVVSIVSGFKTIPIDIREQIIKPEMAAQLKEYKEKSYIDSVKAIYSRGFATPTFIEAFKAHKIII